MKGTRLWQDTGSPLISGRSRRDKPFWRDWLVGSLIGLAAGGAFIVALAATRGSDPIDVLRGLWLPAVIAALVGAVPGVWIASKFGWRTRWFVGSIFSAVFVAGGLWSVSAYLVSRLSGS